MPSIYGLPACSCLVDWLPDYSAELKRQGVTNIRWTRLAFRSGGTSGDTHWPGGGADGILTKVSDYTNAVKIARNMGAAAWHRTPGQGFIHHLHLVLKGCPHNSGGRYQIDALEDGYNGLGGGGRGGRDDGPRSGVKFPLRTWKQGIAWAKPKPAPKPIRTSALLINCASGRNDAVVGGKWVERRKIVRDKILWSDASFILTTELYTSERGWISEAISSKYKLAGGVKGRNIYVRRGRWSRVGVRAYWKPLRSVTRKPVVGIRAKHADSGRVLGVSNTQLSYERTDDGAKHRQSEVKKLIPWAAARFRGMGEIHAGDYNTPPKSSTRKDDVGPIFKAAGFHDVGIEADPKAMAKEIQRVFGSPSIHGQKVRVIENAGSDHPAILITFTF